MHVLNLSMRLMQFHFQIHCLFLQRLQLLPHLLNVLVVLTTHIHHIIILVHLVDYVQNRVILRHAVFGA